MKKRRNDSNCLSKLEFDILRYLKEKQNKGVLACLSQNGLSPEKVDAAIAVLKNRGFLSESNALTKLGERALLPYKVDNAVIMAAGTSSRFVPLSYDRPKALLKVKGEVLIERLICQLQESGVNHIVLVLGYKKEMFFYLEDKFGVEIVINPSYIEKNNIETLWLARKYIGNSYICCSDQYFVANPFQRYVYESYYDCDYTPTMKKAYFASRDFHGQITGVKESVGKGVFLSGEAYWNRDFSKGFLDLVETHNKIGDYDLCFWETLYADNLEQLPKLKAETARRTNVYEFNSLDELREFDKEYVDGIDSQILNNICTYFHCSQSEIRDFRTIKKGLTNTSFSFALRNERYVYRHPGVGANEIVDRYHEKTCLEIAKDNSIDPSFLYEDPTQGWKISKFIFDFREPDYRCEEDNQKVIDVLKRLHSLDAVVDWEFNPLEEALKLEKRMNGNEMMETSDFKDLKGRIETLYSKVTDDGTSKCFCHCDTYSSNWMITEGQTYLIDWEYGGMSDPGVDVGYYLADGEFSVAEAKQFIKSYLGGVLTDRSFFHYLAWAAITSYYWFVWALFKESKGAVMGESFHRWYKMANKYSAYLLSNSSAHRF